MKNITLSLIVLLFVACSGSQALESFGEKITQNDAKSVAGITSLMEGKDSVQVKLTGKIVEVCQNKGCWMTLDLTNDQSMRVTFKDYGFFVPKNAGGHTAWVDGWAYRTITSVDELRHYAGDEGQSEEEIQKITEPKEEITFVANGVLLEAPKTEAH